MYCKLEALGTIIDRREVKTKEGKVWWHQLTLETAGCTLEIGVDEGTWKSFTVGQSVVVVAGVKERNGRFDFTARSVKDEAAVAAKPATVRA